MIFLTQKSIVICLLLFLAKAPGLLCALKKDFQGDLRDFLKYIMGPKFIKRPAMGITGRSS